MTNNAHWPAPAKLNLFLHVTGRRADGMHTLQTVFQFLDHADTLHFRVRDDGVVRRTNAVAGLDSDDDLCLRAARALQRHLGTSRGVDIELEKRLPLGGGLGGGSSDAATALVALNFLWGAGLDADTLCELGLSLGADVPVFVRGEAAWGEGIGEQLTPVSGLPQPWYVVLVPQVNVSTAEVFADPQLTRNTPPITIAAFLAGQGQNDLEAAVTRRYPQVDAALEWLSQFGVARMTGSGACVFAPFGDEARAREVLADRPTEFAGFVARGRNRSPLMDALERFSA